jgi:arylsulfatase A-like enzyme
MRTAVAAALLTGAVVLPSAPAHAAEAATAAPGRPNIVVIMADDQDDVDSIRRMPQLQKLAAGGVHFVNSFVDYSLCCPSRASFLTGQSAHNSGVMGNKPPNGGWVALRPTKDNNLGVWLQAAGYQTAMMGKMINGYAESGQPRTEKVPGWDEFDVVSDPEGPYRYFRYTLNENGKLVRYHRKVTDYQTDVITAKGEDFIRKSKGPFFLLMQPISPHGTHGDDIEDGEKGFPEPAPREDGSFDKLHFNPPANFNEQDVSDKPKAIQALDFVDPGIMQASFRKRREAMLAVDDMINGVVKTLTATGKLDNTYIIFTSDNGYSQGSHRYQGKIVLYEESIRVPLVISGPGVPKGERRTQLVNNLDVVASILEWTGAQPKRTQDGRSLAPVIASSAAPWRTGILFENTHAFGIRTKDTLYTELYAKRYGAEREIYNLNDDPIEMQNRIDRPEYQSQISALHDKLAILSICKGDTCWMDTGLPSAPAAK